MNTRQQLADLLKTVDVIEVAALAGCSTKTVYRLRNLKAVPKVDMHDRLVAAVKALRSKTKPARMTAKVAE